MNEKFSTAIYNSFKKTGGYAVTVFGIVISILPFYVLPDNTIHLKIIVPLAFVAIILIVTFFDSAKQFYDNPRKKLPRVIRGIESASVSEGILAILLIEQSPIFGFESIASVYFTEDNFEKLIGIGYVSNIQENNLIQISILKFISGDQSIWEKIKANNSDSIKKIIVKPGSKSIHAILSQDGLDE